MIPKTLFKWFVAASITALMSGLAAATNYTQYFDTLYNETTGWGMLRAITNTYEAMVGTAVFWVLVVTMPFFSMWIKQQSVVIAAVVALISGGLLMTLIPPEFDMPIKMLLAIGVAGLLWHIFMRRN